MLFLSLSPVKEVVFKKNQPTHTIKDS